MAVVVARYLADGDLDLTFGSQGKVRTVVDDAVAVYDVQVSQQGRVNVLAGGRDLFRIRYTQNGDEETITHMPFFPNAVDKFIWAATSYIPTQVVLFTAVPSLGIPISFGRVVAAGWVVRDSSGPVEMAVAAFHPTGQPDTGFSSDGQLSLRFFPATFAEARAIAVDNAERVIVAGYALTSNDSFDFAVARILKSGNVDQQFSQDGRRVTKFPNQNSVSTSVLSDGTGRILAAGTARGPAASQRQFAMAKHTPTGQLDPTFGGNDGLVTQSTPTGSPVEANAAKGDGSGRFVVVGRRTGTSQVAIARVLSNGNPDLSFGGGGFASASLVPSPAAAMDLQIDVLHDKITVVGHSNGKFAVVRLGGGGLPAPFGNNGSVVTHMGNSDESSGAQAVAIDQFGRIVVAGIASRDMQGIIGRPTVDQEVLAIDDG
jgi:uncharacterized delta-60 repeat protein